MAVLGPNFTNAAAAGFQGQNLAEQLLQRQLQNRKSQAELEEIRRQQAARALIGEALQRALGKNPMPGMNPMPTRPPGQQSGQPAAPQAPGQGMPQPGGAQPLPTPAPGSAQPPQPLPQQGAPQMPAQPMADTAAPAQQPFSWEKVMREVQSITGASPDVIFSAIEEIMPQLDKESERKFRGEQGEANRLAKEAADMRALEFKYYDADRRSNDLKLSVAQREKAARERDQVALEIEGMRSGDRRYVADVGAASRQAVAAAQIGSREKVAADALEWKREYGNGVLDIQADKVAKDFLYRERVLDLREQGMNQQQAQFQAKLEQTEALAAARDATTRRGQDMVLEGQRLAREAKTDVERSKVDAAMPAVLDNFDKLYQAAERILKMPGLESATGPIDAWLLTVFGDTADAEEAIKSLQAMVGFQALADMRAASPTGGALGNVSNREVDFLQATIRSLSTRQQTETFRNNLLAIMDHANRAKGRTLDAYEKRFTQKAAGGPVPTTATAPKPGGAQIKTPPEVAGRRDGTIFEMDGKTYKKQGDMSVETGD